MLIWLPIALLTGVAVLAVLLPLGSRSRARDEGGDVAFYRARLTEIEGDAARGLIEPQDAEAAKIEAARFLLAAERSGPDEREGAFSLGRRRGAALIGLVLVPLIALVFYGVLGAPDRADAPYAEQQALLKTSTDIDSLMLRVEQQLAAHPDDVKGWQVIAPIYLEVARYQDAVKAYGQLLRLKGPNAADFSGQGEALVLAAEGVVTSEARQVFEQALALDGTQLRARYYSAIALEQDGDRDGALARYREMLQGLPDTNGAAGAIRARMAALIGAAEPSGQNAMIAGMVAQLDAKLEADGSDRDGWIKLMRSYQVLGQRANAEDALVRARKAMASSPEGLAAINAAAQELGLGN